MFEVLEGGKSPKIKTEFSSSADLYAREDIIIRAGETKIIPLGVKIDFEKMKKIALIDFIERSYEFEKDKSSKKFELSEIEKNNPNLMDQNKEIIECFFKSHFFELKLRSSLAVKQGLIISNGVGEIDIDYPDEIGLIVHKPLDMKSSLAYSNIAIVQNKIILSGGSYEDCSKATHEMMKEKNIQENLITEIKAGDRVAQIKLMEHKNYMMPQEYRTAEKRTGGYGSTGPKE